MPSTNSRVYIKNSLWCLVDCNNFYVSCEKLFRPDLRGRPVVVLSNNDGCIIARSKEAKAIGVPMGEPWFKIRPLLEKNHAEVFSANFALYGDISNRVMDVLEQFCPKCEQYSIDEAFLNLDQGISANLPEFCQSLRNTIYKWVGVPVSIGVGATPTLAKLANHIAKKNLKYNSLFSLVKPDYIIDKWLENTPVEEIWGIGRGHARTLMRNGIKNALQLKNADTSRIKSLLTVTGLRCALELRGITCVTTWENYDWKRKTILHSRSFGNRIHGIEELGEALTTFTARCAERLRAMALMAKGVSIRARTGNFDGHFKACAGSALFVTPTSNTIELTNTVLSILRKTYAPGYPYAKAGVMLFDLVPENRRQMSLFESPANTDNRAIMTALDKINQRYGKLTLRLGCMGMKKSDWHMKQERRSPDYTTDWHELPIVKCM